MSTTTTTVEEIEYVSYFYDGVYSQRPVVKADNVKATFTEIPVIDVSRIWSADLAERKAVAKELCTTCENIGFLYLKNHGVDQALIDDTFKTIKEYFARPLEEKMQVYQYNSRDLRGYDPVFGENFDQTTKGALSDKKESFQFSYEPEQDAVPPQGLTPALRDLFMQNQWPKDDPEFKIKLFRYHNALIRLARQLMKIFALGLDLEESYFDHLMDCPLNNIKTIHYPPQDPSAKDEIGIGAHTDFSCFTILAQDDVGGLEVLNPNGRWVKATPIAGTFVFNIGDFLQRITNERFVSTVHCVKNISGKERYSIPCFFAFNQHSPVEVLKSCTSEENPAKYEPITVGDYFKWRFELKRQLQVKRGLLKE